ncbi:MAG TPA: tRNA lysidine(34) synthetase TilS [Actinomycetota bacterium]|nr:tRNA lysidine(34) synthetase TilS [Actinomycetota bacterium]
MPRRPPAVARVLERVARTAREHGMFEPGDLVLVSCSGGPDSVCLLYALWHLRRLFRIRLAVFHFDHGLRSDSAKDAVYVRRLAERLGLPFHLRTASDRPRKGRSVEAWAALGRRNAAVEVRKDIGAWSVAEGHTIDDQAETVLLNLIRGSGLEGLTGIDTGHRSRSRLVQPLIDVDRAEVEAFCRALRLRPRRDPMNEDRRFLRAAIRHEVLPILEQGTDRGVKRSIVRTAELLRRDRDELFAAASRAYVDVVEGERGTDVRIDVAKLRALPDPVASRVIRLAAYDLMSTDWAAPWTKAAIDAVVDLAAGRPGRSRDLPEGLKAVREKEYVRVSRASPEG